MQCFSKYTKDEFLYLFLKNCTYLSMVIIYAHAVVTDKTESPVVSAIAVLFLFDGFFVTAKDLKKRLDSSEDKTNDRLNDTHHV